MKLFDGQSTLEFEKKENQLTVFLTGTQLKEKDLDFIKARAMVKNAKNDSYVYSIDYELEENEKSLQHFIVNIKRPIERFELALKIKNLFSNDTYFVPFVHPENVMVNQGSLRFIHQGLIDSLEPMKQDSSLLLSQYKALILSVFNPKVPYEYLINGESSLKDKFSHAISLCETLDQVHKLILKESILVKEKEDRTLISVPKKRYTFLKYLFPVSLIVTFVMVSVTFVSQKTTIPKQNAIISAQANFISEHYDKTLDELKNYQPSQLSKEARFVLASSSVNLSDLSQTQKASVLNTMSSNTDDNTLNFWIYQGRGEFEKSLNLAKNIGDDQLTLLAYTDLYQATKLNNSMDGEEKQKKLEEYNKAIQELSKNLGN